MHLTPQYAQAIPALLRFVFIITGDFIIILIIFIVFPFRMFLLVLDVSCVYKVAWMCECGCLDV